MPPLIPLLSQQVNLPILAQYINVGMLMLLFIVLIGLGAFLSIFLDALGASLIQGGLIGFLIARVYQLSKKVQALTEVVHLQPISAKSRVSAPLSDTQQAELRESTLASEEIKESATSSRVQKDELSMLHTETLSIESHRQLPPIFSKTVEFAKGWLIGGNPFVRAGIVLLFIGVVFLLRFSLEKGLIPVELRLAGSAAAALTLLFFGWRLRKRTGSYGLILQAGGIGLLYLTIFGAFSLYGVIPATAAFALLLVIAATGTLLAILQNSLALAMFATTGGFLAPLLTATGSNNYIGLFGFYALLNTGIVVIAWFKSWRLLNLLGFIFTFVIASLWGLDSYQPIYFSTTQPFLILFVLLFVATSVLFAIRTPVNYKDKVDSTLVFGVPVLGFGMQVALVKDMEHGVAISALILGLFYLVLCKILWRRYGPSQRLLAETFLSLGCIFATLSIPFAVDGALTSATWAIEGVGILWVSVRQQQWGRRAFAIFLHFAALAALCVQTFLDTLNGNQTDAFLNGNFIALLLITISMLVCSRMLSRDFEGKRSYEKAMSAILFFVALILQWLAFYFEIIRVELFDDLVSLHLTYSLILTTILGVSIHFKVWNLFKYLLPLPLILMCVAALGVFSDYVSLTADNSLILWPLSLLALWAILYLHQKHQRFTSNFQTMHAIIIWLVAILLTNEVHQWISIAFAIKGAWGVASLPLAGLAIIWLILSGKIWPLKDFNHALMKTVALPFAGFACVWVMLSLSSPGNAKPLMWLPLLNPLDIIVALTGMTLYKLYRQLAFTRLTESAELMRYGAIFIAFMAINVTVLRVLHHYYHYAWQFPSLLQQPETQTTLAIVWTLFGMALAWRGNRILNRKLWFAGAALLGLVVLKLFFIDFSSSGTLARVISFISVGGLLLFIGYLAPMPSNSQSNNDVNLEKERDNV